MGIKPITVHWGRAGHNTAESKGRETRLAETERPGALKTKKRPNGLGRGEDARKVRMGGSGCRRMWAHVEEEGNAPGRV